MDMFEQKKGWSQLLARLALTANQRNLFYSKARAGYINGSISNASYMLQGRHDTQHNDIPHNDIRQNHTQHNDIPRNGTPLLC
jgi:hypothetical protein